MPARQSPASIHLSGKTKGKGFRSAGDRADRLGMLTSSIETVRNVWDSFLGKVLILSVCLGWMPVVLLNMAREALTR